MHSQSLYLEHFQLQQNPFRQEPDPNLFFTGAGRIELLDRLQKDLLAGEPLINLTGSKGVGKTLLYLLLASKLPADTFDLVCLDHPVGSFEDQLGIICHALRSESNMQTVSQQSYLPEFREHLQARAAKKRRVLLIIDEAEKLFLATLERLVRLICDTDEDNVLQILLVGRPELEKNIEQLVIYCSNVDVNAGYVLEPLTRSETEMYIQYRLKRAGTQGDKHQEIFMPDGVSVIYQLAGGNISQTNLLAEKGLKLASEAGMFKVEGVLLAPEQKKEGGSLTGLIGGMNLLPEDKRWLLPLAAVVLGLSLLFLWPDQKQKIPAEQSEGQVALNESRPEKRSTQVELREDVPVPAVIDNPQPGPPPGAGVDKTPVVLPEAAHDKVSSALDIPEPGAEQSIVIQPNGKKKKTPDVSAVKEAPAAATTRDGELLFEERLRATSSWLAWSYRGGFTIQLMVLASDTAEENLKNLLIQDDYYGVRDNLYILRKASSPVLLVFYGLYASMDEARRAGNRLPPFLLNHQPYALSINEALTKTEQ